MLAASPLSGVSMRQRQSSATIDTQLPVRSTGAASRPDFGGAAGGGGPNCDQLNPAKNSVTANDFMASLPLRQASVHGFDELIGFDEAIGCYVFGVVIARGARGFDLLDRHLSLDYVLDAVAHDDHHVPEFHDVGFVAHPAVARDDVGAAFLRVTGHREIEDVIQRGDLSLHATAVIDIEERVAAGCEDVAGGDDVGAAK